MNKGALGWSLKSISLMRSRHDVCWCFLVLNIQIIGSSKIICESCFLLYVLEFAKDLDAVAIQSPNYCR